MIGSKVQAVNTLGVYAPTVEVIGAKNQSLSMKEEAGFGISAKGDKPKVTFNTEAALRGVITSLIKGESVNALNVVKGNTQFEAQGSITLGIYNHKQQNSQTQTAQASQLSAKQNLTLEAERIQHQGSQLSAGNNIAQGAEHIEHSVATNSQNDRTKNVDVGLSVTSSINKDKAISSSVTLSASGGRGNSQSTTAQATTLNAGNSIVINGQTLQDTATQYQAGGDLTLNSQQHNLQAAVNSSSKDTMKAGVNIGVSGNTSDLKTVNLKVNVGANYQQNQTASEQAQKASLTANNIAVNTNTLYSQADMKADGNINVVAKESATFAQATNKEQQNGVGFKADLGVGALVVPAASAAIPSVDASVSVNAVNGRTQDAVTAKVEGQSITIQSGKNTLVQGTSLAADNINLSGETVNVVAAKSDKQLTDVAVGTAISLGKGASSLGLNANLKVHHEVSNSHTASQVTAQNLNIQSRNDITLTGVQADAKNVTLNSGNGNLALTALQDNVKKTGVGATLSLNGGVAEQKWTPNGGSASLDVNVIRNQTHTSTVVNSETANLNVGGNALLTGSALNADTVSGTVTGDLISKGLVNKVSETSVSVSAS
ncbi:hemagglutinin repeat-containing protein [Glaesserella parasuis]|nr:hemagglutinin repeat-containing protein [Glaesserella parasuis]MCT8551468.1 hemagglutinin repeat-containing protein [Glaesserella parasuis]MCT8591898.1 hemagglutinin repeat-containing protein [Glaesserella parasuis]MDE3997729.1 hemagglutinin repeat-containing protein [Glaesserella parasuis]MDP0396174.1 hemagglutinin repeat-containing protein [Glaesserella parasuis]